MAETRSPLLILAVEDSTADVQTLRALLLDSEAKFDLRHVTTLEAAEKVLAQSGRDVVLLDLGLPDSDGVENVQRIRAAAPDVAIVVLTGRADESMAKLALRNGAQEYLIKGAYDGAALLRAILHAIERHEVYAKLSDEREREYFRASHDALTGLPNRQLFMDRARVAYNKALRGEELFALGFFDLDGFKRVNDQQGHATGDLLLQEVARVLREDMREGDTVARIGGDEFLVLLSPLSSVAEATLIFQRLVRRINNIQHVGEKAVRIGASAGITVYPDDGDELELLFARADEAMYTAKRAGKGGIRRWQLMSDEPDVRFGELRLSYQAWLDASQRLAGFEVSALPMSRGPALSLLSQAVQEWAEFSAQPEAKTLRLAIKAEPLDFQNAEAASLWLAELQRRRLMPQVLRICLPAVSIAASCERCAANIKTLRAAGVQIALSQCAPPDLDLGRLAELPLDAMILEAGWPARLLTGDNQAAAMLAALLAFNKILGRETMMTGVDQGTAPQLQQRWGAMPMQGPALLAPVGAGQLRAAVNSADARRGGRA